MNPVHLGGWANGLNIFPTAFGYQIIAETPQIENRLAKRPQNFPFVRPEDSSADAVHNGTWGQTAQYITHALHQPRIGVRAQEKDTEHQVRDWDCEQRRDGEISHHP